MLSAVCRAFDPLDGLGTGVFVARSVFYALCTGVVTVPYIHYLVGCRNSAVTIFEAPLIQSVQRREYVTGVKKNIDQLA